MNEKSKQLLEQANSLGVEVYNDLMRPTVKPLGEILAMLPRTLKVAFMGWERWLNNKEESLSLTAQAIEDKIKKIPEDRIVPPEAYIAIPAIQQLCYCQNSEVLRDLYANLLVSSMDADKKWQVHPSFIDVIKQLTPDEARYLIVLPRMVIQVVFSFSFILELN